MSSTAETPTPPGPAPDPQLRNRAHGLRWCPEHDVPAKFDVDCFRCPQDNAIIGPPLR